MNRIATTTIVISKMQKSHTLIDSLTRGAVRERILFNRLRKGEITLPDYHIQKVTSERMKECKNIVESVSVEIAAIDAIPSLLIRKAFQGEI